MTMIIIPGRRHVTLNALAGAVAILVEEDEQQQRIITMEQGRKILFRHVQNRVLTSDRAQELENEMLTMGISPNMESIKEKALGLKIPNDFRRRLEFDVRTKNPRLTRGIIYTSMGKAVSTPIFDLMQGIVVVDLIVHNNPDKYNCTDGVDIFRQMIEMGVATDNERFTQLSLEVQAQLDLSKRMKEDDFTDLSSMT